MNRETDLFDQANAEDAVPARPWTAKMSDVYEGLRPVQDGEVQVVDVGPKVPAYTQLQEELGEAVATLETEVHGLAEELVPVLAPGEDVPPVQARAPGKSPLASDLAAYRDRISHIVAVVHDLRSRREV